MANGPASTIDVPIASLLSVRAGSCVTPLLLGHPVFNVRIMVGNTMVGAAATGSLRQRMVFVLVLPSPVANCVLFNRIQFGSVRG